jgi:hypothetical protein
VNLLSLNLEATSSPIILVGQWFMLVTVTELLITAPANPILADWGYLLSSIAYKKFSIT